MPPRRRISKRRPPSSAELAYLADPERYDRLSWAAATFDPDRAVRISALAHLLAHWERLASSPHLAAMVEYPRRRVATLRALLAAEGDLRPVGNEEGHRG